MNRRVSRSAAAFLLVVTLAAPSAFAVSRDRGFDPGFASRIVHFLKHLGHTLGITSQDDIDSVMPGPPKP
jgi:hypothetical protein